MDSRRRDGGMWDVGCGGFYFWSRLQISLDLVFRFFSCVLMSHSICAHFFKYGCLESGRELRSGLGFENEIRNADLLGMKDRLENFYHSLSPNFE